MGFQNLQAQNKGWYLKQLLADREAKEQVGEISAKVAKVFTVCTLVKVHILVNT